MSYERCPTCGDDNVTEYDETTVQCVSCRTPLAKSWCDDSLLDSLNQAGGGR